MVAELGGPADLMDNPAKYLKRAAVVKDFFPAKKGRVSAIDARAIGIGIVELGGGRAKPTDGIDHAVGLTQVAQIGEETGQGARPLATIHAKDEASWQKMAASLEAAVTVSEAANTQEQLIRHRVAA